MLEWWNSVESYLYCGFSDHFGLTLAPPNIAPVAEALIGPYIIIFSGAILGGANPDFNIPWDSYDVHNIIICKPLRVQTYEIRIRIIYEDHRKFNTYFVREFFALKDLYILRFNCEYCRSAPLMHRF